MSEQHGVLAHRHHVFRGWWRLIRPLVLLGLLLAVTILLLVACSSNPKPGPTLKYTMPGGSAHTGVSPSGAYQTSVPIEVPSYHGLEPKLALTYNSHGGNGWVGVGWSLSGLSSILRTSPGKGAPSYDDNSDVFYLDGAELVRCTPNMTSPSCLHPASTNPYWWPYTTRIESFQRIGRDTRFLARSWYVTNKTGTNFLYEPRAFQLLDTTPFAWDLASVQDTLGNTVKYTYWQDKPTLITPSRYIGESYPDSISYNGTIVKFYYELRPDIFTYANGRALVYVRFRLKSIDITVNGVQLRAYTLTYTTRVEGSSRSMLSQIQQYGSDVVLDASGSVTSGTPLPPVTLTPQIAPGSATGHWKGNSAPSHRWPAAADGNPYDPNSYKIPYSYWLPLSQSNHWLAGDLTGDGRQDPILISSPFNERFDGDFHIGVGTAVSRADGTFKVQGTSPPWDDLDPDGYTNPYGSFWFTGDLNGDGKTDIIGLSHSSGDTVLLAGISNGDGTFHFYEQHLNTPWLVDIGIGQDGFIFSATIGIFIGPLGLVWGGVVYQSHPNIFMPFHWLTSDVNGDGRTDLVLVEPVEHKRSNGSTFFTTSFCTFLANSEEEIKSTGELVTPQPCQDTGWDYTSDVKLDRFFTGDVLGNGRSDIMIVSPYTKNKHQFVRLDIGLSNGDGSFTPVTYDTNQPWQDDDVWFPGDPNGDGKADLMQVIKSDKPFPHAVLKSWFSDGTGHAFIPSKEDDTGFNWYLPAPCIGDKMATIWFPGDANGDGRTDFMHVYSDHNHKFCGDNWDQRVSVGVVSLQSDGTYATATRDTGLPWNTGLGFVVDNGMHFAVIPADINGDGKTDIVFPAAPTVYGEWEVDTLLSPNTRNDSVRWQPADVSGDGHTELVYVEYRNPGVRVYTAFQQSDGSYQVVSNDYFPDFANPDCLHWMTVQLGGGARAGPDGRTDLAYVDNYQYTDSKDKKVVHQGIRVYNLVSNGDGSWIPNEWNFVAWPHLNVEDTLNWIPMDVNGDGLTDLVHLDSYNQDQTIQVSVLLANPGGGFTPVQDEQNDIDLGFAAPDTQNWLPMDVNGDGKMDLVYLSDHDPGLSISTLLSNGDGHWTLRTHPKAWSLKDGGDPSSQGARNWRVMDVNGDGKMDLVHLSSTYSTLEVATLLSVGNGTDWAFEPQDVDLGISTPQQFDWADLLHWKAADINGDGRTDLVHMMNLDGGVGVFTLMSDGVGGWIQQPQNLIDQPQFEVPLDFQPADSRFWKPADVNGDGITDFLHVDAEDDKLHVSSLISLAPLDLLASVSNGYGATTSIDYGSSSAFLANDLLPGCFLPEGVHLQVVSSTIITDSHTPEMADTERYTYSCAQWSYRERGLLSWGRVTSSRESTYSRAASQTVDTYLATDSCLVQPLSTQLVDDSDRLYSSTDYLYARPAVDPPYQCQVVSIDQSEYDQTPIAVDKETWYCYDAFGNIVRQYEAPEGTLLNLNVCKKYRDTGLFPVKGPLLRTTLRVYNPAIGPDIYIVGLLSWEGVFPNITTNAFQEKPLRSTFYCYDYNNGPSTKGCPGRPTRGLLTAVRSLISVNESATTGKSVHPQPWPQPQSTLWGIALASGISLQQIEAFNPWIFQQRHTWDLIYTSDIIRTSLVTTAAVSTDQFINTLYSYDRYGNQTDMIDPNRNQTHTDYDSTYHLYPIKTCLAYKTSIQECTTTAWNYELGLVTSSTDANNYVTTFPHYDPFGRLLETDYPNGQVEHRTYYDGEDPAQPRVVDRMDDGSPDGLWTKTFQDGLGRTYRVVKKGDAQDVTFEQDTTYADASSLIAGQSHWYTKPGSSRPLFETYYYDSASRILKQVHPDQSELKWEYGNDGTNTSVTSIDERLNDRTTYSDAFGRVSEVQAMNEGQNATTMFVYDAVDEVLSTDELLSTTDASGNVTAYGYDMLGHQTSVLDPDRGLWTYQYDPNGNLLSQTDAKKVTLTFTYDALNRLHTKRYSNNKDVVTWNYDEHDHGDSIGQLTSISDPTVAGAKCKGVMDSYSYNTYNGMSQQLQQNGQVTSQTQCVDGISSTMQFSYDILDRLQTIIYPGNETVMYSYDPAGRLQSVSSIINNRKYSYVDDLQYNATGQLTKAVYGNHTQTDFTYDPQREWLCQMTVEFPSSQTSATPGSTQPCEASGQLSTLSTGQLYEASYQYYINGLIQSFDELAQVPPSSTQVPPAPAHQMHESFKYDDLNQLLKVSGDSQQSFTYDSIGNMKTNSMVGTYSYYPTHPQEVQQAGTQTYTYDANGSMMTMSDNATQTQKKLTWNDDHLLASITDATKKPTTTTTMTYDASGERVAEITKTYDKSGKRVVKTAANYFFGSLLEYSSKRGLIKYYYAGPLLAAQNNGTGTYWYHQDQLGSVRLMTNEQGSVVAQCDYTPFGQRVSASGSQQCDIGYTGQRTDTGSGMVYMHGRYYDPQLSRFISADPFISDGLNPQALNRYAYVYNDPINNTDPSGYSPQDGGCEGETCPLQVIPPSPPPGNPGDWAPFPTPFTPPPPVSAPDVTPPPPENTPPVTQYPAILNEVTPQQSQSNSGGSEQQGVGISNVENSSSFHLIDKELTLHEEFTSNSGAPQTTQGAAALIATAIAQGQAEPGWSGGQVPYSWGGGHAQTPGPSYGTKQGANICGVDCSGFARWVYYLAYGSDVLGPGTASAQLQELQLTTSPQPGDLVFFGSSPTHPTHVGIYIGNGMMIDAPRTGFNVRISPMQGYGTFLGYYHYNG